MMMGTWAWAAAVMCMGATDGTAEFRSAKAVWPAGREREMNVQVAFRAVVRPAAGERVTLRLTASSLYRATVNGRFVGHGPARGPHGWFRVDEWDLTPLLSDGPNVVGLEAAGYNSNSYYLLDVPSFVQAEVLADGRVLASTAGDGVPFDAAIVGERVQKVQRYSFQRPFSEAYRLAPAWDRWRTDPEAAFKKVTCTVLESPALLPRRVPYPTFDKRPLVWHVAEGRLETGLEVKEPWKDRSLTGISERLKGYPESELATIPSLELQAVGNATRTGVDRPVSADARLRLEANSFHIVDFGTNLTGFLGAKVTCREKTRLFLTFDEVLAGDDVSFKRLGCVNIIACELEPGTYTIESFEPYTMRYLKPMVLEGDCDLEDVYLREYVNPDGWRAQFAAGDERLNRLFAAARQTFVQNAVDVFMDCPSRERAGWLCDSFFTARAAWDLCGDTRVEKNFIENYLLPPRFAHLPEGMLPMCYPGDHNDGVFIPNWAMWFVVELEEYLARSGDRAMVDALKPRVLALLGYLKGFENSDGLLEKLPSWVFVEWSAANQFVQDVNYPSNMLYAGTLAAAGRLYADDGLLAAADRVRATIREQSFDGEFFVDHAVRKDGKLEVARDRTEVCQYYAFFFDVATFQTHGPLWKLLHEKFGPKRDTAQVFPEIHVTNHFIGNQLRLELLSRDGRGQRVLDESVDYNLYMADRTGTLWENVGDYASCNHGFASHAAHVLIRDVLGVAAIDAVNRKVRLRFGDVAMDWCEGRIPTPAGPVSVRWWKADGKFLYRVDVPAGFVIETQNLTGRELLRRP